MDQKQSNGISKVFGTVFITLGICMLCIGIPFIVEPNKNSTENWIMALFIISGTLMIIGGRQSIKMAKLKEQAMAEYLKEINHLQRQEIKDFANSSNNGHNYTNNQELSPSNFNTKNVEVDKNDTTSIKPEIIAEWNYTTDEWKLMTKEETKRRFKEGIWVSLLIGLFGGWIIHNSRGATLITACLFSLGIGIFLSLLKVMLSNHLFKRRKENSILITSHALIINHQFKTIRDIDIQLEYVKSLEQNHHQFIEFSLKWQTRRGVTNDQIRILVPKLKEHEINKVLNYFENK
jgi:hypothetical protein